jgi:hypothetical protein
LQKGTRRDLNDWCCMSYPMCTKTHYLPTYAGIIATSKVLVV